MVQQGSLPQFLLQFYFLDWDLLNLCHVKDHIPSISMICEITELALKLYDVDSFFLFKCAAFYFQREFTFQFHLVFSFGRQFIMFDLHCSLFRIFSAIVLTPNARILQN